MDARAILTRLRLGRRLTAEELAWFAEGLANGDVGDAQAGAFAMGVLLRGLSEEERVALTLGMRDSGSTMSWDLAGPTLDKHSTGGLGDCVSLALAPALAALGAFVPMVSGRGLGHTGGTLDKLEAIPGLTTEADQPRFREIVAAAGCAIVAASAEVAPADRRLYAIRDICSAVESIDLITASILSKKLAAGLDALVLDVKLGSGAFMRRMEDAEALAESLVYAARGAGCATRALITDMNQPLAPSVGNALEVAETMKVLAGDAEGSPLAELTARLGGEALALGGLADDGEEGAGKVREALRSGSAAERFGRMVRAMGGPGDFVERWSGLLPAAQATREATADRTGFVAAMDGVAIGEAVVRLGGGRIRAGDRIDPSVGLSEMAALGDAVSPRTPLAVVHAADEAAAERAAAEVRAAVVVAEEMPELPPIVRRSVP